MGSAPQLSARGAIFGGLRCSSHSKVGHRRGCVFAARASNDTNDRHAAWFFVSLSGLVITRCFESLEYLVKRLSRGGFRALHPDVVQVHLAQIKPAIDGKLLKELRDPAAHGYHLTIASGWMSENVIGRYQEMAALLGEAPEAWL